MSSLKFQRDALIDTIYDEAKKNSDIFFLSADFGAPSLDRFRKDLPSQFIHTGISEQNTIDLAAGLALDGRKVFAYAMAPFITLRCLEQHKCSLSMMNLNVCTIVAGIGLGYADAGPTHYLTEDLGILRSIIKSNITTASDSIVASKLAKDFIENPSFNFIRLDRHSCIDLKNEVLDDEIMKGYRFLKKTKSKICVISHGSLINNVVQASNKLSSDIDIIDLIRIKPIHNSLAANLKNYEKIIVVDEQSNTNGLFSAIHEFQYMHNITTLVVPINLPEKYVYENGGRDYLLKLNNLDPISLSDSFKKQIN